MISTFGILNNAAENWSYASFTRAQDIARRPGMEIICKRIMALIRQPSSHRWVCTAAFEDESSSCGTTATTGTNSCQSNTRIAHQCSACARARSQRDCVRECFILEHILDTPHLANGSILDEPRMWTHDGYVTLYHGLRAEATRYETEVVAASRNPFLMGAKYLANNIIREDTGDIVQITPSDIGLPKLHRCCHAPLVYEHLEMNTFEVLDSEEEMEEQEECTITYRRGFSKNISSVTVESASDVDMITMEFLDDIIREFRGNDMNIENTHSEVDDEVTQLQSATIPTEVARTSRGAMAATVAAITVSQLSPMITRALPCATADDVNVISMALYLVYRKPDLMSLSVAASFLLTHFKMLSFSEEVTSFFTGDEHIEMPTLQAGSAIYEDVMADLKDDKRDDTSAGLECTTENVSAFVNSPLGQRGMNFLGSLVGAGFLRRESIEFSYGDVKLWAIPERHVEQCTALTILDQFFKLLEKSYKTITRCMVERNILPLAYDDQDLRKYSSSYRKIKAWHSHLSPGNIEMIVKITEDEYGEIMSKTCELGDKILNRKLNPFAKKALMNMHVDLCQMAEEFKVHVSGKAGRLQPFVVALCGGTGCGKTSINVHLMKSLCTACGYKIKVAKVDEYDAYASSSHSDDTIVIYEDANNAKNEARGRAASSIIMNLTGPDITKAVKAAVDDKDKVSFMHKFLGMTTNTPDFGAGKDSNCPESVLRRIRNFVEVEPLPWLADSYGSSMLNSDKVAAFLDGHGGMPKRRMDSAVQRLQLFHYKRPIVDLLKQGNNNCSHVLGELSNERHMRTILKLGEMRNELMDMSRQSIGFGFWTIDHHADFEQQLIRSPYFRTGFLTYEVLLSFLVEEAQYHFTVEKKRLNETVHQQQGADLCLECFCMNANCKCTTSTGDTEQFVEVYKPPPYLGQETCVLHVAEEDDVQGPLENITLYPFQPAEPTYWERCRRGSIVVRDGCRAACVLLRNFWEHHSMIPEREHLMIAYNKVELNVWQIIRMARSARRGSMLSQLALRNYIQYWVDFLTLLQGQHLFAIFMALGLAAAMLPIHVRASLFTILLTVMYMYGLVRKSETRILRFLGDTRTVLPDLHARHIVGGTMCAALAYMVHAWYKRPTEVGEAQSCAYNLHEKVPISTDHTAMTMAQEDFQDRVRRNIGKIYIRNSNAKQVYANCFCIGSNVYIFPKHMLEKAIEYKIQYNDSKPTVWHKIRDEDLLLIPGKDMAAIMSYSGGTRQAVKHLLPEKEPRSDGKRFGMQLHPRWEKKDHGVTYSCGQKYFSALPYPDGIEPPDKRRKNFVHVEGVNTVVGDCYSVVVTHSQNERAIVGFHFGALGTRVSISEVLLRHEADNIIDQLHGKKECHLQMKELDHDVLLNTKGLQMDENPHAKSPIWFTPGGGCIELMGRFEKSTTPRAQIGPTLGAELVYEHLPVPPDLRFGPPPFVRKEDGSRNYPYTLALIDCAQAQSRYCNVREIVEDYIAPMRHEIRKFRRSPLTRKEIVGGIQGGDLSPLKMSTSAGFPHYCKKNRFATLTNNTWELDADVWHEFEMLDTMVRAGRRVPCVFRATLKNEPVVVGKDKKARVFCAGPMLSTMLVRKYFGPLIAYFHGASVTTECACGVDALSEGWQNLFAPHAVRDSAIAFDYKKFDRQVTAEMKAVVAHVLIELLQQLDYDKQDIVASETLLMDYVEITLAVEGAILRMTSMMPSGFPLTTIGNSIDNSLRVRSALQVLFPGQSFRDMNTLTTYGDDAVLTTDHMELTLEKLAKAMSELGITITGTDKSDTLSDVKEKLADVSFLSRTHVVHRDLNLTLGALEDSSLYKGLLVRDTSRKSMLPQEHFVAASRSFIYEIFAHGKERYERERAGLIAILKELKLRSAIPEVELTYEQVCTYRYQCYTIPTAGLVLGRDVTETAVSPDYEMGACVGVLMRGETGRNTFARDTAIQPLVNPARRKTWRRSVGMHLRPFNIPPSLHLTTTQTNESAQHSTTQFEDAMAAWHVGEHVDDPSRGGTDTTNLSLNEFLERPVRIQEITWTDSSQPQTFNPWVLLFQNDRVRDKLRGYRNMRASLAIKVIVNGSRFHSGKALLSYVPRPDIGAPLVESFGALLSCRASQHPHISLNPTTSMGGEMTLPFFWHNDMLDLTTDEIRNMGELTFVPFVSLGSNSDPEPRVSVSIFARFENVVLSGATRDELAELQMGEIVDTPISSRLRSFANFASLFSGVPIIGKYMKATEMAGNAAGGIASHFGYSEPPQMPKSTRYHRGYGDSLAGAHQESTATALTHDPKSEVTIDPSTTGLPSHDEMAFQSICSKKAHIGQRQWTEVSPPGTTIMHIPVSPSAVVIGNNGADRGYCFTPLGMVSMPFKYWRGTLKYRFEVVATAMHSGRLRVYHEANPGSTTTSSPFNTVKNLVVDISSTRDFTVEVPWISPEMYLQISKNRSIPAMATQLPTYNMRGFANGHLIVEVENQLVGPEVLTSSAFVVVSVSSDDIEYWGPGYENIPRVALTPTVGRTNARTRIAPYTDNGITDGLDIGYVTKGAMPSDPPTPIDPDVPPDPDPPTDPDPPPAQPLYITNPTEPIRETYTSNKDPPIFMEAQRIGNQGELRWDGNAGTNTYKMVVFSYVTESGNYAARVRGTLDANSGVISISPNATAPLEWPGGVGTQAESRLVLRQPALRLAEVEFEVTIDSNQPKATIEGYWFTNDQIRLRSMDFDEIVGSATSATDVGSHVTVDSDLVLDLPDRVESYSMIVCSRTAPVVNGTQLPTVRNFDFGCYLIPPTTGTITIAANDFRRIQYVSDAALQSGQVEDNDGDHAPDMDVEVMDLGGNTPIPTGLNSICYDDPIVSFRTMFKRATISGYLGLEAGFTRHERPSYPLFVPAGTDYRTRSFTLLGLISTFYKGIRGSTRKKLIPLAGNVVSVQLSRNAQCDSVVTPDEGVEPQFGLQGSEFFPGTEMAHISVPYHAPRRFIAVNTNVDVQNEFDMGYNATVFSNGTSRLAELTSTGEDFNLFFFVGSRTFYDLQSV